jgi:hypothetical protein
LGCTCRKTCLECGKALLKARAKLDSIKPRLPARKLPAAPPSLPATPNTGRGSSKAGYFVSDDSRASIERWIKESVATISPILPSNPPMATGMRGIQRETPDAMRTSGGTRISPTSAVWGDDDAAGYFRAAPVALGDRHLSD